MPVYIAAVICLAAILHGTLGIVVAPLAGVCLAPILIIRHSRLRLSVMSILLLASAAITIAASIFNGFSAEGFCTALLPLAAFVAAIVISSLDRIERRSLVTSICGFSVLIAVIGFIFYVFAPGVAGVDGKHLVYGFANANTAALWFAACSLLCFPLIKHNRFLCLALAANTAALILTCSVLVVGLWLLALLVLFIVKRRDSSQMGLFLYVFIGIVFAVAYYFCQSLWPVELVLLVAFAVLVWFMDSWVERLVTGRVHFICAGVTIVALVVGCFFSLRLQQEFPAMILLAATLILDGCRAIIANPLAGVGAGMWPYENLWYQSSSFTTSLIPDVFVQAGVDAGILAALVMLAFFVFAFIRLRKGGLTYLLVAVLLLLTVLVTPTMCQFAFWGLLLAVVELGFAERRARLAEAEREEDDQSTDTEEPLEADAGLGGAAWSLPLAICAAVVCIAGMLFGPIIYWQTTSYMQLGNSESVEPTTMTSTFVSTPAWVINSPCARAYYDSAVIDEGISRDTESEVVMQEAEDVYAYVNHPVIYDTVAQAYIDGVRYDFDGGLTLLLDAAKRSPHSAYLYGVIQSYLSGSNCDEALVDEALALAEENGYEIEYTPLTKEDKELYAQAEEDYYASLEEGYYTGL